MQYVLGYDYELLKFTWSNIKFESSYLYLYAEYACHLLHTYVIYYEFSPPCKHEKNNELSCISLIVNKFKVWT